jgi:asparagine synthase (glutamine-hydrolysing)
LGELFSNKVLKRIIPNVFRSLRRQRASRYRFAGPGLADSVTEPTKVFADSRKHRRQKIEKWHQQSRLEDVAQIAAPHGIAYSYPLLDIDLVSYAMRLPGIFFYRDGVSRAIFRDALHGVLPEEVRLRSDKNAGYYLEGLRVAQTKDLALGFAAQMSEDPVVTRMINISEICSYIEAGPDVERAVELLERHTLDALGSKEFHGDYLTPLAVALFIKAQDASHEDPAVH